MAISRYIFGRISRYAKRWRFPCLLPESECLMFDVLKTNIVNDVFKWSSANLQKHAFVSDAVSKWEMENSVSLQFYRPVHSPNLAYDNAYITQPMWKKMLHTDPRHQINSWHMIDHFNNYRYDQIIMKTRCNQYHVHELDRYLKHTSMWYSTHNSRVLALSGRCMHYTLFQYPNQSDGVLHNDNTCLTVIYISIQKRFDSV